MSSGKPTQRKRKPTERDRRILTHLGRLGISYNEVIRHLFFGKVDPADVLQRLLDNKWIESVATGEGNRKSYHLTAEGAKLLGLPEKPPGSRKAPEQELILYFCCLSGTKRMPLTHEELVKLFDAAPVPEGTHCLEMRGRRPRLYNMHVPGDGTPVREVAQAAKRKRDVVLAEEAYRPWVSGRLYSVAILVEADDRADRIREMLSKTEDLEGDPLTLNDAVVVERVPAIRNTLKEALDALQTISKKRAS